MVSIRKRFAVFFFMCALLLCRAARAEAPPDAKVPATGKPAKTSEAPKKTEARGVRNARHARGEMTADRPELSVSSRTVQRGLAQLEMKVALEGVSKANDSKQRWVAPSALMRFGVADGLELRLASDILVIHGSQSGMANATAGLKWNFAPGDPSYGLLAVCTLPLGHPALTVDHPQYRVALLADFPLGKSFEARINAGAEILSREGKWRTEPTASVALFTRVGRSVELHVEYGRYGDVRPDGRPSQMADAGVALIIDADTQIDLAGFKDVTGKTFDWKMIFGFARRF